MPKLYMMVGLPGSGKSTYIRDNLDYIPCISSDAYIDDYARSINSTYEAVFDHYIKEAEIHMWSYAKSERVRKSDVVIDRTNLSVKSRRRWLNYYKGWEPHCIVVSTEDVFERNLKRADKKIPLDVIRKMSSSYQVPTYSEGFKSITFIKT